MYGIKRTGSQAISDLLELFPCVTVVGSRQVGKTTIIKNLRPKSPYFDLEKPADYEVISRDPYFFLKQFNQNILIDEAQRLPELFTSLRSRIDEQRKIKGHFLLTGSSSPILLDQITESLAGRVAIFELSGLSLEESWQKPPSPFFKLLSQKTIEPEKLLKLKPRFTQEEVWTSCLYGQYPEAFLNRKNQKFFDLWMQNYISTYVQRDIRNLFPNLDILIYQKFITMLSHSSGEILNASNFARSLDVSQPTIKSYLRIMEGTFLWRTLPSYSKNVVKRIVKMPKGHLRDSGLINHLLRIESIPEFLSHPQSGKIWEAFIIEEILKGFQNNLINVNAYHYRTHHMSEIGLILVGKFGILPIEIKMGMKTEKRQLIAMETFLEEHKLPIGMVINNGEKVLFLSPKIIQIPATYL